MDRTKRYFIIFIILLAGCGRVEIPDAILNAEKDLPEKIDFNLHVKPILSDKCFACHGPDKGSRKVGLRLDLASGATAELTENPGKYPIVPGNLKKSQIFHRITAVDQDMIMPPREFNVPLTDYEKAILIRWMEEGAEYKPHWAYIRPEKKTVPDSPGEWVNNPIDNFVIQKLREHDLEPAQEAEKDILLRRVTLDLTGLPPTIGEMEDFVNDPSDDAYEKVVDRLLASSAYGEQMAVAWMDLARYADTHGYSVDRYRDMSPWRDWVIKAFNENMTFDDFIQWQLAGDLLPDATREQLLATGFNRNHQQNMEGGIINEEFRVEYVADRTNTLGKSLLALSLECARCHDHKFDPVTQKNYYELFSFFNNVDEAGQISWDDMMPVPTLLLPEKEIEDKLAFIDRAMAEKSSALNEARAQARQEFNGWKDSFDPAEIEAGLHDDLVGYFPFENYRDNAYYNAVDPSEKATCIDFEIVEGYQGKGFKSNGDDQLRFESTGVFSRADPFTIALWIHIPDSLHDGVIFHKGEGAIIYDFKGYHLALRGDKLEVLMAHNWPYNAILKSSEETVVKGEWMHLALTYDGLSKASGLKLYIDGRESQMIVENDNLYKDILFGTMQKQPALTLGARWRGTGTKEAVYDEVKVYKKTLTPLEVGFMSGKMDQDEAHLFEYFLSAHCETCTGLQQEIRHQFKEYNALNESVQEVMIMSEMPQPRQAYILERGNYAAHGDSVFPNTPEFVYPFPEDLPKNRLGLAEWLVHENNPLTARVFVNRLWQKFFGNGIVTSSDDFGSQGSMPSHPALLDWLAIDFMENNWDMKQIQKKIVMSATYRQSSGASKELRAIDPDNRLLARGPSSRLSAEMLRDNALKASGLLVERPGGKSVKPYQPPGLWEVNGVTYKQDTGTALYKRSLYTFWKRSVPPPAMGIFDAPDRSYMYREKTGYQHAAPGTGTDE